MKAARIKRSEDREDAVLHTQHSSELMQDIDPEPPPPEIDPDMGQINLSFEGMVGTAPSHAILIIRREYSRHYHRQKKHLFAYACKTLQGPYVIEYLK